MTVRNQAQKQLVQIEAKGDPDDSTEKKMLIRINYRVRFIIKCKNPEGNKS